MSTTKQRGSPVRIDVTDFAGPHWTVVFLAAISGFIHLYLYTTEDYMPFLLAGLGFFGAIALLVALPDYRKYLWPVGILFVLAQIGGYVMMGSAFDTPLWMDVIDKAAQVLLVAILGWLTYKDWL